MDTLKRLRTRLSSSPRKGTNKTRFFHGNKKLALSENPAAPGLDLSIKLGNANMTFSSEEGWHLDESSIGNYENEITSLQRYVDQLEKEKDEFKKRYDEEHKRATLLELKNRVLLQMVATANLDLEKDGAIHEHLGLKCDALRWELARCMTHIRKLEAGIESDDDTTASYMEEAAF